MIMGFYIYLGDQDQGHSKLIMPHFCQQVLVELSLLMIDCLFLDTRLTMPVSAGINEHFLSNVWIVESQVGIEYVCTQKLDTHAMLRRYIRGSHGFNLSTARLLFSSSGHQRVSQGHWRCSWFIGIIVLIVNDTSMRDSNGPFSGFPRLSLGIEKKKKLIIAILHTSCNHTLLLEISVRFLLRAIGPEDCLCLWTGRPKTKNQTT